MPTTDPPEPEPPSDAPGGPDAAAADAPPADAPRPGPVGITRREVADAIDAWRSRTGSTPSIRQLRQGLGGRGSLTTISRLRNEVLGERLVAGDDVPARASPDAAVLKALAVARAALAADAAAAADDAIAVAAADADERVRAADARAGRGEQDAVDESLARERAAGRAEALETEVEVLREERRGLEGELAAARERETAVERARGELDVQLGQRRAELEHAHGTAADLAERLAAAEVDRRAERADRAEAERAHTDALAAQAARAADLDRHLARTEGERDAATARADEAVARAERAETARLDDARRAERALAELAGARRADLARCHARIDQLIGALGEADLDVPDPAAPLPSTEFQPGLLLDDAGDVDGPPAPDEPD